MEKAMHKLIIILLNYMYYKNVPLDELLDYFSNDDEDGKRQLFLLFEYEVESMNEVNCDFMKYERHDANYQTDEQELDF